MNVSRGVLYPGELPSFHRLPSPDTVASLVRWFWIPEWELRGGATSRQELLSHPASNLVVEPELVGFAGPTSRRSFRDLHGSGWAVGALLLPAAVPFFTAEPVALRDQYRKIELPELRRGVAAAMTSDAPAAVRAHAVEAFTIWLRQHVPDPTGEALLANAMADHIADDSDVLRIEDVAALVGVSPRTLQRLAQRYIGVTPAAMIRRRRLQEAAEVLRTQPDTDIATVAAALGYSDHAHLTNDFHVVLGFTPSAYRNAVLHNAG